MAEQIGQFMAGWPSWAVWLGIAIVIVFGLMYHLIYIDDAFGVKEWWQDKERRLKKETRNKKLKQRRG